MKLRAVGLLALLLASTFVFIALPASTPAHAEALSSWAANSGAPTATELLSCVLDSADGLVFCANPNTGAVNFAPYNSGDVGSFSSTTALPVAPNGGVDCTTDGASHVFCDYRRNGGSFNCVAYYATMNPAGISGAGWTSTNAPSTYCPGQALPAYNNMCSIVSGYEYCGGADGTQPIDLAVASVSSSGFGTWSQSTGAVTTATESCTASATTSAMYCVGGYSGSFYTSTTLYCPISAGSFGTCSTSGATTYPFSLSSTSCGTLGAYLYCVGGKDTGGVDQSAVNYAPITASSIGAWTSTSAYTATVSEEACIFDGGLKVVTCLGGSSGGSATAAGYYTAGAFPTFECSITNADAGNYLLPSGKFYDFRCSVDSNSFSGSKAAITDVRIRFNDSVATVGAEYANGTSGQFVQNNGSSIATLSNSGAVTSTISGAGDRLIVVNFLVSFSTNVADSSNRGIYLYAEDADNVTVGYTYLGNSFNFLNKGGAVSVLSSGDCSIPAGADTFQTECHYGANSHNWIAENATYSQLQNYQSQFAIQMSYPNNSTLLPSIWEPYNEGGSGANPTSNKGDWTLAMGLDYYDNTTWVKGISFKLEMLTGRVGSTNLWTAFEVLWYDGSSLVANNTVYAFVPADGKGPSQVNIWVNLWFSQNNESMVEGGEIGAYYTGMHSSNYLLWSSWSPFLGNESQSQTFVPLLNHAGDSMSSQSAQFAKVFYNMTRPGAPEVNAYQPNFQIETLGFTEQEFGTASAGMTGVTTPSFTVAIVPTISSSSIFSPIINAIKSIATLFGKTLEAIGAQVWATLGQQFPWFTSAIGNFTSLLLSLVLLMGTLIVDFIAIVKIIYADIGLVLVPFEIIGNAYGFIKSSFGTLLGGVNSGALIEVVVIFFFCSWFFSTMESKNPAEGLAKMASTAWHILDTMLVWTWYIAKMLIDAIEGLIP